MLRLGNTPLLAGNAVACVKALASHFSFGSAITERRYDSVGNSERTRHPVCIQTLTNLSAPLHDIAFRKFSE
jgi:hypothetical protein